MSVLKADKQGSDFLYCFPKPDSKEFGLFSEISLLKMLYQQNPLRRKKPRLFNYALRALHIAREHGLDVPLWAAVAFSEKLNETSKKKTSGFKISPTQLHVPRDDKRILELVIEVYKKSRKTGQKVTELLESKKLSEAERKALYKLLPPQKTGAKKSEAFNFNQFFPDPFSY